MNLKIFNETYFELEKKIREIMTVYSLTNYYYDSLNLDVNNNNEIVINIMLNGYSNYFKDTILTFKLDEMNEDIEYFKTKFENAKIKKEIQ